MARPIVSAVAVAELADSRTNGVMVVSGENCDRGAVYEGINIFDFLKDTKEDIARHKVELAGNKEDIAGHKVELQAIKTILQA